MNPKLLIPIVLLVFLFSCEKEDRLSDPNQNILLSKKISGKSVESYEYDNQNKLVKMENTYNGNFNASVDLTYWDSDATIYFDITQSDLSTNRDSLKYFRNENYCMSWDGSFGKNIYYFDKLNKVTISTNYMFMFLENEEFIYSAFPNDSVIYEYYDNNKQLARHYCGQEEIATITTTYDNRNNPYEIMPFTCFYMLGNIISTKLELMNPEDSINFYKPEFDNEYEYNTQGYPIKEIKTYKGTSESVITYFEYIEAK